MIPKVFCCTDQLENEDNLKYEDNLKNEDGLKNEDNLKTWPSPQKIFLPPPSPLLKNYLIFFLITSHLNSHRKCYQVFKPEMELHMINIIYAALPISENKKDNICMQR